MMSNYLDIRNICFKIQRIIDFVGVFTVLYFVMSYRVVLGLALNATKRSNWLIFSMLNNIFVFARAEKYVYLCMAKDPYYGNRPYRYRAHDNTNPLRNATGVRGIVGAC